MTLSKACGILNISLNKGTHTVTATYNMIYHGIATVLTSVTHKSSVKMQIYKSWDNVQNKPYTLHRIIQHLPTSKQMWLTLEFLKFS